MIGSTLRAFTSRPRFLVSLAILVAALLFLPEMKLSTRFVIAWDLGVSTFLALAWTMMARSDHAAIQRRAEEEDAGAVLVLVLTIVAAVASLGAIGAELRGLREAGGPISATRLALTGATILLSWFFVHTIFALHYAHDYYAGEGDRGGLKFPEEDKPDYWDFMYFAFTIGAAAQTSDVSITARRMRRFVLAHTVLSFLFNTTILALAINVGAGML